MKIYFDNPEYDGQFLRAVDHTPLGAQIGEAWAKKEENVQRPTLNVQHPIRERKAQVAVSCAIARKQTRLGCRPEIAMFLAFVVVLLIACNKGNERSPVSVPADCQQFLNKYFDAWKSKDVATLQA